MNLNRVFASKHVVIWGFAALFYLYEMVLRVAPSVMTHGIMSSYHLNATSLGFLASLYYVAYVLLQVPSGILIDKFGARKVVTVSCLICAIGAFFFGTTEHLLVAQISRFMVGVGSACAFVSCLKIAGERFSPVRFPVIAALSNLFGTVGGAISGRPLAMIVENIGWRETTVVLSGIGFILALGCWFFIRDFDHGKDHRPLHLTWHRVLSIFGNPFILVTGIVGGLLYVPISAFAELWAIPYLMKSLTITNSEAASINPLIFIGMAVGGPAIAHYLSPKVSIISSIKISSLILFILFISVLFIHGMNIYVVSILFFITGFWVGGQVLCFSLVKEQVDGRLTATAMGVTNALVMLSGVVFQPALGRVLDLFWDGSTDGAGIAVYSLYAYQISILSIAGCMLLSFGLLFYLKMRNGRNGHHLQQSS